MGGVGWMAGVFVCAVRSRLATSIMKVRSSQTLCVRAWARVACRRGRADTTRGSARAAAAPTWLAFWASQRTLPCERS